MRDQEIRFALVMNGGVSLAVWIAGVSHEIDLIRRASTDVVPGSRVHDSEVYTLWRDLLKPNAGQQRRLVIDVLAGTSAGGLNGAMLANAIAHNGTLDPEPNQNDIVPSTVQGPWLREVWCALGGLRQGKLLPEPEQNTGSVLDGHFFQSAVERIMERLSAESGTPGSNTDRPNPVTLFTTASGLGDQQYTATDAAGQPFDVTDHRFLFRFTTDKLPVYNPAELSFNESTNNSTDFADFKTLALAARASASFPVAFQPVRESEALNSVPPRLRPQVVSATSSWLMDGGVLDNAPFAPVLDTIAKGQVSGDVSRFIVYVVPSVGIETNTIEVNDSDDEAPNWVTALASAIRFPREVDFRSDVEELERLRLEAETAWSDTQYLYRLAVGNDSVDEGVRSAAESLQPTYTRGRAAGGVWEAIIVGESGGITALDKDAAEPMEAADDILKLDLGWTPPVDHPIVTLRHDSNRPIWPWGIGPAERVVRTVLRYTRSQLRAKLVQTDEPEKPNVTKEINDLETQLQRLSTAQRRILSLRAATARAITADYDKLASSTGNDAKSRRKEVLNVANLVGQVFKRLRIPNAIGREIYDLQQSLPNGEALLRTALAIEVVSRCTSSRTPDQRSAPFSFVRLGPDADLPVLGEDANALARSLGNRILYGTQLGNFGAFGADKWRRWDWLMGRLHAASHLGMLMHDTSTPDQREIATTWISTVQAAILAAEGSSVSELTAGLKTVEIHYQNTNLGSGFARMLDAMNAEDDDRPADERSTRQMADRLVAVASGLGAARGSWIQALAGRTGVGEQKPLQRAVRWFFAPARASLWKRFTGEQIPQDEPNRGTLALLRRWLWATALVAGLAILALGIVIITYNNIIGGVMLVFIGVTAVLVGVAGLVLIGRLKRLRNRVCVRFNKALQGWLPPST